MAREGGLFRRRRSFTACWAGGPPSAFMQQQPQSPRPAESAALVLGYLNFSSGAFDPVAWRAMNDLYAAIEPAGPGERFINNAAVGWKHLPVRLVPA